MSLFVTTLLAAGFFHFHRFYQSAPWAWLFVVGWVPISLAWIRAAVRLYLHLDRQPFRALDLGLESDQAPPGSAFVIEIHAEARRRIEARRLFAELRCTRYQSTERGKREERLASDVRVLEESATLEPGERREFRVSLPLAEDAPFSFRSMGGKILWSIHVGVDVEDWGEIRDELGVTVAPG